MRRPRDRRVITMQSAILVIFVVMSMAVAACTTSDEDSTTDDSTVAGESTTTVASDDAGGDTTTTTASAEPAASGGTFTFGLATEPVSLDPADGVFIADHQVMLNIYDPLIWTDQNGELQPGLATAWDNNAEGTEFTFTLREDVVFHDGTPFNGDAVKAEFDRIPTLTDGFGASLQIMADYESTTVEGNEITVTFASPKPEFLNDLSRMWMAIPSPTAVESMGDEFDRNPVGTGPFVFGEWAAQDHITLVRNDAYAWGRGFAGNDGPPLVDELVFRILPEASTRLSGFQTGELDAVEDPPFQQVASLVDAGSADLMSYQAPGMPSHMMLNTEKAPTDDPLVREAMIRAVNTDELSVAAFAGLQTPVSNVIAPTTFAYSADAASLYSYDVAAAGALLDEAGWVDSNGDGIREKDGVDLTVVYPASPDWEAPYMELFAAYLSAVGFSVDLQQLDDAGVFEVANAAEHNIVNMGWISSSPSVLGIVYHSANIEQGSSFTRFADPALDAAIDGAAGAVDPTERAAFYQETQDIIMSNALAIPLYTYDRVLLLQPAADGWQFDSEGYAWLTNITTGG